jgi:squalene-hopene/tetraprenyl-beta-curcumene cyclase
LLIAVVLAGCQAHGTAAGADAPPRAAPGLPPETAARAQEAVDKGLAYLAARQDKEGGWTAAYGPAVTAIAARAFCQSPRHGPGHAIVQRAVTGILRYEQSDGGIYERKQNLANYQTSVVLMLLPHLPEGPARARMARAQRFLTTLQYDEAEDVRPADPWFGGAGYNSRKRPDLSNTQMMLEALHASGLAKTDPVYQRALKFVSRCQMNEATNDLPLARGATDGGFIYSPHGEGESKASENLQEGAAPLRSYGSMTYAGFKSLLYAGLKRDDPRVSAALKWIRSHYTLEENPGMPPPQAQQGLYYYYQVFARALAAWGEPVITDDRGNPHNWRIDLCRKVVSLQRPDGSWVNEADRWLEGDPNYVTALTVLTLQTALQGS